MELLEDTYEVACDQAHGVTNHLPLCDSPEDHQKANSVWVTGFFSSLTSSDLCQASLDLAPVHPSSAEPLLQNTHCRTTALLICSDLNLMSPRFDWHMAVESNFSPDWGRCFPYIHKHLFTGVGSVFTWTPGPIQSFTYFSRDLGQCLPAPKLCFRKSWFPHFSNEREILFGILGFPWVSYSHLVKFEEATSARAINLWVGQRPAIKNKTGQGMPSLSDWNGWEKWLVIYRLKWQLKMPILGNPCL